jgi:hypothetical protein
MNMLGLGACHWNSPFCTVGTSHVPTRTLPNHFLVLKVKVKVKVMLQLTVSQSVCLGFEPQLGLMTRSFLFVTVAVLSIWGAFSDERTGLSFVSHSQPIVSIYIYLQLNLTLISTSMYYIYKASVSPGSVQQIMPNF